MRHQTGKIALEIATVAVFVALITVSAQIPLPLPSGVPFTLQTLLVALSGYCLGVKRSLSAIATYIALGAIGLPVFSGFSAGPMALLGKTGGFIFGFLFLILACALAAEAPKIWQKITAGAVGILLCHLFGCLWYAHLTEIGFPASVLLVSLPFLLKDMICVGLAALFSGRLQKALRHFRD